MDRIVLFLAYGFLAYLLGIICSKKDFFSVDFLKKVWLDIVYFLFVSLTILRIIQLFWQSDSQNTVQILIFFITATALIYQGFLSRIFRSYINRPIVKVFFDDSKSEYFHKTLIRIYTEILIRQGNSTSVIPLIDFVPAYYTRLR